MSDIQPRSTDSERPGRILIVDDEAMIVEMLTMGLTYEGFEVSVARTGPDALEHARTGKPDLVVLDLMLPGMDGLEVCRRLQRQGDIGIIMLTARRGGGPDPGVREWR